MKISKLFHWLYAGLMVMPLFAILSTCCYVAFNKNAEIVMNQTSEQNVITKNEPQTNNVNSVNDLVIGNYYRFFSQYDDLNEDTHFLFYYISNLVLNEGVYFDLDFTFNQVSYYTYIPMFEEDLGSYYFEGGADLQSYTEYTYFFFYFYGEDYEMVNTDFLYQSNDLFLFYKSEDWYIDLYFLLDNNTLTSIENWVNWFIDGNYDFDFIECISAVPNGDLFFCPTTYTEETIEVPTYNGLGDVFYYAVDTMNDNPFFAWAHNSFLSSPILYITSLFNMPSDSAIILLLCYWFNISIIWLTFDVMIYVPLVVHRWLDKGGLE